MKQKHKDMTLEEKWAALTKTYLLTRPPPFSYFNSEKLFAESRILLMEHKYPPTPLFFFFSSYFYAYFRLG